MGKEKRGKKQPKRPLIKSAMAYWLILLAVFILVTLLPNTLVNRLLMVVGVIVILYSDHSGIREYISRFLPETTPFIKKIRRKKVGVDHLAETYKTASLFCVLCVWFFPITRVFAMALAVIIPALALARYLRNPDIVSFSSKRKDQLSATASTFFVTGAVLLLFSFEITLLSKEFWLYVSAVVLTGTILFFVYSKYERMKFGVAMGFVGCMLIFSIGTVSSVNQVYDFTAPAAYEVAVLEKDVDTTGKGNTYYLTVSPFAEAEQSELIRVSKEFYNNIILGEHINIWLYRGALHIPWYQVSTID